MPASDANLFIEFCHVYKGFGPVSVLRDVSFEVRRGETVCLLGRSGVGKSVTLKLIMGFLHPDQGQILNDGVDVASLDDAQLTEMHKKITMVFQSGALFDSLTVADNVAFPLRERQDTVRPSDAQAGMGLLGTPGPPARKRDARRSRAGARANNNAEIETTVNRLLDLLDLRAVADSYPASLSTGMKRAVAIARALAAKPEAILYDEPTTMVDPLMSNTIAELIARVKRQVRLTSLVVTHDTQLARKLADRLVMLHDGGVRFFGSVAEMEASPDPVLREFFDQDALAALV